MPKRAMSWVLIVWTAIFAIWIGVAIADRPSQDCPPGDQVCQDAGDVGTGIGVGLVLALFFVGFVILSLIWFMARPKRRVCPACGTEAKKVIHSPTGRDGAPTPGDSRLCAEARSQPAARMLP